MALALLLAFHGLLRPGKVVVLHGLETAPEDRSTEELQEDEAHAAVEEGGEEPAADVDVSVRKRHALVEQMLESCRDARSHQGQEEENENAPSPRWEPDGGSPRC